MAQTTLRDLGVSLQIARSDFNKAWIGFWADVVPCNDEKGFKILQYFINEVDNYVFIGRKDVGVKHAANEMFRLIAVGNVDESFEDMRAFAKWYGNLKGRISDKIRDLFDFRGDGFGDLVDSLPLAGVEIVKRALATNLRKHSRDGFLGETEISAAVEAACEDRFKGKNANAWHRFIFEGENYIESTLESQARTWYLQEIVSDDNLDTELHDKMTHCSYGEDD